MSKQSIINSELASKAREIEDNPRYTNLTQADKAKLLGVSPSTYSRAIHYKPDPPTTTGTVEAIDNTIKIDPNQSGVFYTMLLETNNLLRELMGDLKELKEMLKYDKV